MTKTAVSYWELGKVSIPRSVCLAMETLYGVSSTWLLEGIGPTWLPKTQVGGGLPPDLLICPLLPGNDPFDASGTMAPVPPSVEILGLPRSIIGPGSVPMPFWMRATDPMMRDTLGTQALVLVDASEEARKGIVDHSLYLVRLGRDLPPSVRRLASEPISHDLVVATEVRGQVPLRLSQNDSGWGPIILGRILWVLKPAT